MKTLIFGIFLSIGLPLTGQHADTCKITYEIGITELADIQKQVIDTFLQLYESDDSLNLEISGSADYLGDPSYNQVISDKRVDGVIGYISTFRQGISFQSESQGEINSHLESKLGSAGQTADRSVRIIARPIRIEQTEVVVDFKEGGQIKTGESLILKNLNFYPGRHQLLPASIPYLKELLDILLDHPDVRFEIQGHICCLAAQPTERDGKDIDTGEQKLSYNRAQNIYQYLVRNGVDSTKLVYRGYGFSQPMNFPETNQEERMENRRVVIKVLGGE